VAASSARLLAFLEILQDRPFVTGRELARRLEVDLRTVRRYAATLHELGIPVDGERGPAGGYRLRPGYKLPPLMLTDDEATAVVFGLVAARRLGVRTADEALAKVRRVLPAALRARVEALEATLGFTHLGAGAAPPGTETVLTLSEAARRRRRVRARYTSWRGEDSERDLSPYGLVVHAGRWYLAAHDHGRGELRTFRVDRMRDAALGPPTGPPPEGFDAVAHVSRSLASVPWTWEVEVLLETSPEEAGGRIPPTLGELTETDGGVLLRMRVETLDYMARLLADLGWPFVVRRPDELRAAVSELADRLRAYALSPGTRPRGRTPPRRPGSATGSSRT
jgi:predicted DNA-binding transcriptional regulator YafY